LLKTWIRNGALVVVEGEDEQRKPRRFIAPPEVAQIAPLSGRCDNNADELR
jgi:hypothetical protein